jgi:lipoprotein-anchoring transpeptidase ErfK/SrfK
VDVSNHRRGDDVVAREAGAMKYATVVSMVGALLVTAVAGSLRAQVAPPTTDAGSLRLVISVDERMLTVVEGGDTLLRVPVGVARGDRLVYGGRTWAFRLPPGERRVVRKLVEPVWTPPDWHYAETARDYGLRLAWLGARGVSLRNGAQLVIRNGVAGLIRPGEGFGELPLDEHIVFDGTLFIPPLGTLNRRVAGDLGAYALDLGDGYLIHGTSDPSSIGEASTHGCIRVRDDDLRWLYDNVAPGTRVLVR